MVLIINGNEVTMSEEKARTYPDDTKVLCEGGYKVRLKHYFMLKSCDLSNVSFETLYDL